MKASPGLFRITRKQLDSIHRLRDFDDQITSKSTASPMPQTITVVPVACRYYLEWKNRY